MPRMRAPLVAADVSLGPSQSMNNIKTTQASRLAMRAFPTGVAVVTAGRSGAEPPPITVSSLTSVSLQRRLLLWRLSTASARHDLCAPSRASSAMSCNSGFSWRRSQLGRADLIEFEGRAFWRSNVARMLNRRRYSSGPVT